MLDASASGWLPEGAFSARAVPDWIDVVTLNTSGGVAAAIGWIAMFTVGPARGRTIAAQAAERFYRALPGSAAVAGAHAYRSGSRVRRRSGCRKRPSCSIAVRWIGGSKSNLPMTHGFLAWKSLVFGRAAMGEAVEQASLRDLIRIRRDGNGCCARCGAAGRRRRRQILRRKAVADGARAIATLVYVARDAEAALDAVRTALPDEAGASAWNGMLIARILASGGAALRARVTTVLRVLRGQRPLPRVWMC